MSLLIGYVLQYIDWQQGLFGIKLLSLFRWWGSLFLDLFVLFNYILCHLLQSVVSSAFFLAFGFGWVGWILILDSVGHPWGFLSLCFRSTKALDSELFLGVIGQIFDALVDVLLHTKLVSKPSYLLLHLVSNTDWDKIALVLFGIVHAYIVIATLLLGPAVWAEAARLVLYIFKLALKYPFLYVRLLLLFINVKLHLFQLVAVGHILWETD